MLYSLLSKISFKGQLDIVDSKGKIYNFGKLTKENNISKYVKIKFHNKLIERKIFFNPSLYIGEAYMNKELTIEEGTIEDFIDIISDSYDEVKQNSFIQKLISSFSTFIKPLQQLNYIKNSKKNVAHHYDLNEELYKLFLDKDMQYSCGYFFNDNISLDQSQIDKKNHIIKKLNVKKTCLFWILDVVGEA